MNSPYNVPQIPDTPESPQDYLSSLVNKSLSGSSANEPESTAPRGMQMGPRFRALASNLGVALDGIVPGVGTVANAALGRVAGPVQPSGKRSDFTDADAPQNFEEYAQRLAHYESHGNATAANPHSTASGLYQYTDPTWGNFGGYRRAMDAPPDVQTQKFKQDFANRLAHNNGDLVATTGTHFLGAKGFQKVMDDPTKLFQPVNAANRDTTPYSYLSGILGRNVVDKWLADRHINLGSQVTSAKQAYNLPANGAFERVAPN